MVGHSVSQDGVGFPHLSHLCYWYLAGGEEKALPYVSLADVRSDIASLVLQVKELYSFCQISCVATVRLPRMITGVNDHCTFKENLVGNTNDSPLSSYRPSFNIVSIFQSHPRSLPRY